MPDAPNSAADAAPLPPPDCPRCRYDQSGAIATWETAGACPLAGRCPECGLEFRWSELLCPARTIPWWSFEHASRPGVPVVEALVTAGFTLLPDRMWRALRLEHPVNLPRAAGASLLGLMLCHAAIAIMTFYRTHQNAGSTPATKLGALVFPYAQWQGNPWSSQQDTVTDEATWVLALWALLMPVGFLALQRTLAVVAVRWGHIWRIWWYALVPLAGVHMLFGLVATLASSPMLPRPQWTWGGAYWSEIAISAGPRTVVCGLALVLFWGMAVKRYLRLPHAWGVACAMVTIAFLSTLALALPFLWNEIGLWLL